MLGDKTVLGVIPARGGSKGVPRKNIRQVANKPLIAWTIQEAVNSCHIDRLILSSEDDEIIQVACKWGCDVPFVRPHELATDNTPGIEPVLHALGEMDKAKTYDYVVVLQPTSPLRSAEDIDNCLRLSYERKSPSCVSVVEVDKSPYWMYKLNEGDQLTRFLPDSEIPSRRQDLPVVYALNGAVYVAECSWLKKSKSLLSTETIGCVMPKERSIDIDTEFDLKFLEYLLSQK